MYIKTWNIEQMTGYHPISTFYEDFSIADRFGKKAVLETCGTAFREWKEDVPMLTELVMVLNWKIWEHYGHNDTLAEIYDTLWRKLDQYCCSTLKGEDLSYYYRTTD